MVEEKAGVGIAAVYEITVKRFDNQRTKKSHQAIQAYNSREKAAICEVIVICRESDLPEDAVQVADGRDGRVYEARDTRLDRIVAIKICKGGLTERFEREARAISSLNHLHICALYRRARRAAHLVAELEPSSAPALPRSCWRVGAR
jgi:hypothetical protein